MPRFLILRLDGPMQAWGTHTYEDFRPSNFYPTRSGLLGLLAACLGIDRDDREALSQLAESIEFNVRVDSKVQRPDRENSLDKTGVKLPDYHTILEARRANRPPKPGETVQSWREYLFDAAFTVAIGEKLQAAYPLERLAGALCRPCYTPTLGRRSCPPSRPLLDGDPIEADDALAALRQASGCGELVYSESISSGQPLCVRDVPLNGKTRQFVTRIVYLHREPPCS